MFRLIVTFIFIFSISAQALNLDEARSSNAVTEMPTGYVKANNQEAETKELVKRINEERKKAYAEIAKKNNLAIEQVAAQAAKKIQEKLGK